MPGPARATSSIRVSSAVFAFIYKKAAQASDDGSHLRAHGRRTRALSRTHPAWLFVLCWRGSTEPSWRLDRRSTRLNSSHVSISYAVFCLKKKKKRNGTPKYSSNH